MNESIALLESGAAALAFLTGAGVASASDVPVDPATIVLTASRADHAAVATVYEDEAARLGEQSLLHGRLAKLYGSDARPDLSSASIERHCKDLESKCSALAELNRELATLHHKRSVEADK